MSGGKFEGERNVQVVNLRQNKYPVEDLRKTKFPDGKFETETNFRMVNLKQRTHFLEVNLRRNKISRW